MTWAGRRRLTIALIVGAIIVAFLAVVFISIFYKTPSCTDGIQNQSESGVDCGGPCAYLCTAQVQAPVVLFTKVLDNGSGRTDVIAMVQNKNANAAAKNVPYRVTLYSNKQVFIQQLNGTVDLPPNASVPVYITGVESGNQKVASAFLEIDASAPQWFTVAVDPRIVPTILNATRSGSANSPRVDAVIVNPSTVAMANVKLIALVKNIRAGVIAVSQTVVPVVPAQGQSAAMFTWSNAFDGIPTSVEVIPVIPLP